jgi:hypothetical protein
MDVLQTSLCTLTLYLCLTRVGCKQAQMNLSVCDHCRAGVMESMAVSELSSRATTPGLRPTTAHDGYDTVEWYT